MTFRVFILLWCLVFSGCFHAAVVKPNLSPSPLVTGSVINLEQLKAGGKLALTLFKAGPQAEANEQLDKLSLMLVQGITERFKAHHTPLTVVSDETADFVMEGYIEEFSQSGKFSPWLFKKGQIRLAVSGEIWLGNSGVKALTFAARKAADPKKTKAADLAYDMGQAIGDFIAARIQGN